MLSLLRFFFSLSYLYLLLPFLSRSYSAISLRIRRNRLSAIVSPYHFTETKRNIRTKYPGCMRSKICMFIFP
ncbi:hypothetical protein F5Y17DRAFT_436356 [Xylariaceae sp. FL0594]|nr:hypothetical protein F5Y17DRAFT_436356 [Xylariaceae sp. FL0594]